jgi:hypothetical protein
MYGVALPSADEDYKIHIKSCSEKVQNGKM